jgi:uncharacterized protein YbaP (TraB family)
MSIGWLLTLLMVQAPSEAPRLAWMGASRSDAASAVHCAARRYERPHSPSIWLVGVMHLGDGAYYETLDALLEPMDIVVFEAVLPAGAQTPGGVDDADRIKQTQASLKVLADAAADLPDPPQSMEALSTAMLSDHRVMANIVRRLRKDAWGNDVQLVQETDGHVVRSLGADGRIGGDGSAADIDVQVPTSPSEDGSVLQRALGEALNMSFQLNNLPYERPNWVPGDMSAEEVGRRLSGGDGAGFELGGLLTGSSLSGKMAVGLIRMLPAIDAVSGGRAIDGLRLMMVEMLSNQNLVEKGVSMYGEAFEQVILHDRNDAALAATFEQAERLSADQSVAVLYGAAHMMGIDRLLREAGWQPVETRWLEAMTVDFKASNLTPADIAAVRQWSKMAESMLGG